MIELRQRKLKKTIGEWEEENSTMWPLRPNVVEMMDIFPSPGDSERVTRFRAEIEEETDEFCEGQRNHVASFIDSQDVDSYKSGQLLGYHSDAQVPAILFVCKESYNVASKFYEQAFSSAYSLPQTWINTQFDTLYLRHGRFSPYVEPEAELDIFHNLLYKGFRIVDKDTLYRTKQLAVSLDEIDGSLDDHVALYTNAFGNLEEFTLVLEHFQEGEDDHTDLVIMDEPVDYGKACTIYENIDEASTDGSRPS